MPIIHPEDASHTPPGPRGSPGPSGASLNPAGGDTTPRTPRTPRLDHAVALRVGVSRRQAQRLIAQGRVRLNGHPTVARDKGRLLTAGDVVDLDDARDRLVPDAALPLTVLAEGPGWVVVEKPAGRPVHPLRRDEGGTLLNAAAARYPVLCDESWEAEEGSLRRGVVHRLDVDTSGCVLLALNEPTWQRLRAAFRSHRVGKTYHALVHGHPADTQRIVLPLAITRHRPAYVQAVASDHPDARLCALSWRVLERFAAATLVEIDLETGFLHQVRATFTHLGHPLVGDRTYPPQEAPPPPEAPRHMLHAHALSHEEIRAVSPAPEDFVGVCERLRSH